MVRALLRLTGSDGHRGEIKVQWPEGTAAPIAAIDGTMNGMPVVAGTSAP
jgi:hypothetical protein